MVWGPLRCSIVGPNSRPRLLIFLQSLFLVGQRIHATSPILARRCVETRWRIAYVLGDFAIDRRTTAAASGRALRETPNCDAHSRAPDREEQVQISAQIVRSTFEHRSCRSDGSRPNLASVLRGGERSASVHLVCELSGESWLTCQPDRKPCSGCYVDGGR